MIYKVLKVFFYHYVGYVTNLPLSCLSSVAITIFKNCIRIELQN